jgi:hypothetical protein
LRQTPTDQRSERREAPGFTPREHVADRAARACRDGGCSDPTISTGLVRDDDAQAIASAAREHGERETARSTPPRDQRKTDDDENADQQVRPTHRARLVSERLHRTTVAETSYSVRTGSRTNLSLASVSVEAPIALTQAVLFERRMTTMTMASSSRRYLDVSLIALAIVGGCGHSKIPASRVDGGGSGGAGGSIVGQDASDTTTAGTGGGGAGGVAGGGGADAGPASDAGGDATGGGGNAGILACPDTPPLQGTSCAGQTCVYEDCAGAGRTVAQCHPPGSFELTLVITCTPATCAGATASPCPMGSLCLKKPVNGALTPTCLTNPCGRGPITCACAGCSGACSVVGTADGVTVTCQTP